MMTLEQLDKEFYTACHEVSCLNVPTREVVRMLRNLNISRMQAAARCGAPKSVASHVCDAS